MLKWDIDCDYWDAKRDKEEALEYHCPICLTGTMRPGEWVNYGSDRDGRRGVMMRIFGCNKCGHEEMC